MLKKIKSLILPVFIRKWSKHDHAKPPKSPCNICLVCDGNWKIHRFKCVYSGIDTDINTDEFENVEFGCRLTPERDSYYCHKHRNFDIKFKFNDGYISINPNNIQKARLSTFFNF